MSKTKSDVADKSGDTKGAVARRQANVSSVQNVLLVWLDNSIDTHNKECQATITELRRVVNDIKTFTDSDQCVQFIEDINNNKAWMIISGSLGQHIVPRVHDMPQVDAIFIFCGDKKRHEQWAKQWPKIKGVFTEISSICEALKQEGQQNSAAISLVATNENVAHQNLDQLDPSFMYTLILKEILLTIEFKQEHIQEFADYCREQFADNDHELNNIKNFEREYRKNTPVWWYTSDCFLYRMVNSALRRTDVNIIIKMGFFIADLHRHIEQLHSEQFGGHHFDKIFKVYRGQSMSKEAFEELRKTQGGLMSFNNFLSTSKDRQNSHEFANQAKKNPDLVGVLFVMTIDPSQSTVPFADISSDNYYHSNDEILFSMHTVFRIRDIKPLDTNNNLFEVKLTLTNDTDKNLCMLGNRIREETSASTNGWYRLSRLLLEMGKIDEAQEMNNVLLEQTSNDTEKGDIYEQLGMGKYNQGKFEEAITSYEKALEIRQKTLPPNHPDLASSYNNIGLVYEKMEKYSKAISYYEKAIQIQQRALPPNDAELQKWRKNLENIRKKV
jgi:tetratricopeptide (TPR) repeat protein